MMSVGRTLADGLLGSMRSSTVGPWFLCSTLTWRLYYVKFMYTKKFLTSSTCIRFYFLLEVRFHQGSFFCSKSTSSSLSKGTFMIHRFLLDNP